LKNKKKIKQKNYGKVLWITGLSGAGKTTLALELVKRLRSKGVPVIFLDGDELREVFGAASFKEKNHGRKGRLALAMQYAHLCRMLAGQGFTVVIATISLFQEVHQWNRQNLPGYFEIYLKVPVEELRRRDPKGIYKKYDAGEIQNVAGLDLKVDEPLKADLISAFSKKEKVFQTAKRILKEMGG
jgi:cytidine diphosphoramidate kinase